MARARLNEPDIVATGGVFADREGSLWMSTTGGLVQIPDPDVWSAAPAKALVTRDIVRTRHGVWGTFWGALAFLEDRPGEPRVVQSTEPHYAAFCADGDGRIWTALRGHMVSLDPSGSLKTAVFSENWDPVGCGQGFAGRR